MCIHRSGLKQSAGGIFEVSIVAILFFWRLDMLMREYLCQHLVSCTIKDGVTKAVAEDEDLLFNWDLLPGQLSHETSHSLLNEITDVDDNSWTCFRKAINREI